MSRGEDNEAIRRWEAFRREIIRDTNIPNETRLEQKERIKHLEKHPEEWFKFYFPSYYTAEPAPFHVRATKRLLKNKDCYEVRPWARELAKSTRGIFEDIYLILTQKAKNLILASHNFDNAVELLMSYMINLESNRRIAYDYGAQRSYRAWEMGNFKTVNGASFRALGAGQNPRGIKNEEARPDIIRIDDIDTDQDCRNDRIMANKWAWIEEALLPTVSVSGAKRIIFQGNLISKNSIIAMAMEQADHAQIINIRDKYGKSTWPQKNSEESIDKWLRRISYHAQQKEYFNNPITRGTVFDEMHYKKLPPLKDYKFVVLYGDPSFKDGKKNDYKAVVMMGRWKDEYHVIKAWLGQVPSAKMADWYREGQSIIGEQTNAYYIIEANGIQDMIAVQMKIYMHEQGWQLPLIMDDRKKGDKFSRIESALEPLNRNGKFYLNEAEKDNPSMKVLEDQFLSLEPSLSAHDDGPDACEGGKYEIDKRCSSDIRPEIVQRKINQKYRY